MAEEENLTPMMIQYRGIKEKYKNEVVFFRLGDFYEMFDEDAVEVSRLLNLTLTHRASRPMCGIPYHAAKIYIARLLRLGKKIVICEQVGEIPKGGKGITERKVVEIITPGTAVEAEYLEGNRANYLAALSITKAKAGFAFIDVFVDIVTFFTFSVGIAQVELFALISGLSLPKKDKSDTRSVLEVKTEELFFTFSSIFGE